MNTTTTKNTTNNNGITTTTTTTETTGPNKPFSTGYAAGNAIATLANTLKGNHNTSQITTTPGGHYTTMNHSAHSAVALNHAGNGRIVSTVRGEERFTGESNVVSVRQGEARYTGETRIVDQRFSGKVATGETRIVGHEKGLERQVSVAEVAVGEEIISQQDFKVGRGKRGKKVIREEVIEKIIVVPETIQIEEWVEDEYDMEETVIEVAKKYQIEKIVEVPEIEIVEKIIEQVETIVKEKIVEVPKIETIEKIVEVPVIKTVEVIVEVPEVQYNDVPVEKIIEIPDIRVEEVICERKQCNFVEKNIEQIKLVADSTSANRKLPVPVEAQTIVEFTVAAIRANYVKKKFPVYLPRFIEVPVSRQFVSAGIIAENDKFTSRINNLTNCGPGGAVSLGEIEKVAAEYKAFEMANQITQKKANLGTLSQQEKEAMFMSKNISLDQFALYKNLPIEVSNLQYGATNWANLGASMTYSSATFGKNNTANYSSYSTHTSQPTYAIGGTSYTTSTHQSHPSLMSMIDTNNDGKISVGELASAAKSLIR